MPQRFDAHFFLAVVGPGVGVDVEPDNTEATELTWVRPVEESLRPAVGRCALERCAGCRRCGVQFLWGAVGVLWGGCNRVQGMHDA